MEVWEFGLWEVEFGVGILPKKEVAETEFPAGANHKIDVWEILVEIFREVLLGEVFDINIFVLGELFDGVDNFSAAAIVEAEIDGAGGVVFGFLSEFIASLHDGFRQRLIATRENDANIVIHEFFEIVLVEQDEDIHEMADFFGAALEVFGRENVETDVFDAAIDDMFCELLEVFEAGVVALHASEAALFCPATVAVNNNGDMGRKFDDLSVNSGGFRVHIRGNYIIIWGI